jgi:hypothetical protein
MFTQGENQMAEPKTKATQDSVTEFIDSISDEVKRKDAHTLLELYRKATHLEPVMWGSSIIGFDSYLSVGKNGHTDEWPLMGFSPRKQALTLYMMGEVGQNPDLLAKLGKHSLSKGCLYIKRLSDVDVAVLGSLVEEAYQRARVKHKPA